VKHLSSFLPAGAHDSGEFLTSKNLVYSGPEFMVADPLKDAEIEIVCPRCGYRTTRTPARLRRTTMVVCPSCGHEIVADRTVADHRDNSRS